MKEAHFVIDTYPTEVFNGYTNDEDWNGWACPYFEFEIGQKIVAAHTSQGQKAWFDEGNDSFVFEIQDEKEIYPAVKENGKKIYPIGNGSWIWEEIND